MANGTMSEQEEEVKEYNIFRDSLLRYLGYTNEVGGEFNKRGNRPKSRPLLLVVAHSTFAR